MRRALSQARTLGQYTLENKIGVGGMGTVYRASHSMLRRPTAIKLLSPDKAEKEAALKRFEREVQITSLLTHPNTIEIYDYGRTPDDLFYYAMEYLPGVTLEDLVPVCGPLPPQRVIHILTQVCGSLGESHSFLLIHRDIKPANIMLCERGGIYDMVKVLDFGLVKGSKPIRESEEAHHAVLSGTPLYMSPEAITRPREVGPASDLYSLGAVGYYLLTAHPVFQGATVMEVCTKHLSQDPIPPSKRVGKYLPTDLEAVILACLEKDPQRRPKDAGQLASWLEHCSDAGGWDSNKARIWWDENGEKVLLSEKSTPLEKSGVMTLNIDLKSRKG